MQSLFGLGWALGGGIAGCIFGAIAAQVILAVLHPSVSRVGESYFAIYSGLIGMLLGIVAGLLVHARSAPAGEFSRYLGSGSFGLGCALAAAGLAFGTWAYLIERPVRYENEVMASLQMELRLATSALPLERDPEWFSVEVQTLETRPSGDIRWSTIRTEGENTVIPVTQFPLFRAGRRVVIVTICGKWQESFVPSMARAPNPNGVWSEWYRPIVVDDPYGNDFPVRAQRIAAMLTRGAVDPPYDGHITPAPPKRMFELRYRVR